MRCLFIDKANTQVQLEGKRLQLWVPGETPRASVPVQQIERLICSVAVSFDSRLLQALSAAGVTLVLLNPRRAEWQVVFPRNAHGDVARRIHQYAFVSSSRNCLPAIRWLLVQKLRSQYRLLHKLQQRRPECRKPLFNAAACLRQHLSAITQVNDEASARGLEGAVAACYFAGYKQVFAAHLGFECRNRRPPEDPVNAVLSLSYTLLHVEAVRALTAVGLDPYLGFYHCPAHGRESLACDLVELFRARIDYFVWRCFANNVLRAEHFNFPPEGGCWLGKTGRANFYANWANELPALVVALRRCAGFWVHYLQTHRQKA